MDLQELRTPAGPPILLPAEAAGGYGDKTGMRVQAEQLVQVLRGRRRALNDISLTIEPGELVAVIGESGTGKTLLLEALAGVRPPTSGVVRYDGQRQPSSRTGVGYVPQDDIIHRELPLGRTLRYAARLRLPAGTSGEDIGRRVDDVLTALGLADRAGLRVGLLSGGERKRASIGVELLTRPRLFFLDEPTSGLDPVTAAELMGLLRRLAAGGVTVVFTTHSPADVEVCDRVAVLARDGHLAFAGRPAQACTYFGVDTIGEIYRAISAASPDVWSQRFQASPVSSPPARPAPPAPRTSAGTGSTGAAGPAGSTSSPGPTGPVGSEIAAPRRLGPVRQCALLTVRTADIMRSNRLTLAVLLGSPLTVLAMFLVLFRAGAFDPTRPSPSTTVMILFWIAFGGFFFGLTYGLLQICTEFAVLHREFRAGLRLTPYALSKVAVLLPLLAAVDLLLLGVLRGLDRLPAVGARDFGALYVTLLLASLSALALGLLCSAAVSDATQATLALPMLCFPQVLFVGAILPVPLMAPVGRALSFAMSNRWSFEALGRSAGVELLWREGGSPLGPPLLASYGNSFSQPVWQNWLILAGFTVAFLLVACAVLTRKCGGRQPGELSSA